MTSLSETKDSETNDKEFDLFVSKQFYSPSINRNKENEIEMSLKEIDLKLIRPNLEHPGSLIDAKEYFNENRKLFIALNLTKCEPRVNSTQMTSDYVEEFCLDPTHDYSKYSPSSRYELNKNFNLINQ